MEKLNIPKKSERIVGEFIKGIKSLYGEEIISVMLYGSAASGEYSEKYSNINIAVILKDARLANLSKASRLISKFPSINPIFLTEDYIKRSLDVFPIEFLDMAQNHNTLYGRDVLRDINIDVSNLRFQCEQELKSKIINFKRVYLKNRARSGLRDLLFRSFTSSLHVLGNILRVKGHEPSHNKESLLDEIGREFRVDVKNLKKIIAAKAEGLKLDYFEMEKLFFELVDILEKVAEVVDEI